MEEVINTHLSQFYALDTQDAAEYLLKLEGPSTDDNELMQSLLLTIGVDQAERRKYIVQAMGINNKTREEEKNIVLQTSVTNNTNTADSELLQQITIYRDTLTKLQLYYSKKLSRSTITPLRTRLEKIPESERSILAQEILQLIISLSKMPIESVTGNSSIPISLRNKLVKIGLGSYLSKENDIGEDLRLINIVRKLCIALNEPDYDKKDIDHAVALTEVEI